MKLRHLVPFAILLAWQAAPEPVRKSPSTRFALSLGYGLAQFEDATFDCNGNFVSAEPVKVRSVGARADMVTSRGLRVTAFGGNMTSRWPWTAGSIEGVQVAYEGKGLGIGAGVTEGAISWERPKATFPNLYLRLGGIDSPHFRFELLPPSETSGLVGYLRAGVGFNQSRQDRVGGFAGVGVVPGGGTAYLVAFADLAIPTGAALDVLVRSQIGMGHEYTIGSIGLGARYRFGR